MPRRLGPFLRLALGRRLNNVSVSADDLAMARDLASKGTVVWVHRARNPIDHLALSAVIEREHLPHADFVGGLNVLALQTLPVALSRLRRGPASARREEALLERCVRAGCSAEIFLRRPLHLLSAKAEMRSRFVEVLVRAQRALERPIFLVPVFLALRQRPGNFEPSAIDAILGSVEEPGLLRAAGRFIAAADTARLELSEPIDLSRFVTEFEQQSDAVIAKKARWTVMHHLARVERIAHGPALKSHARLRDEVLKDHKLKPLLTEPAAQKRAKKLLDEIAARFDVDVTRFLDRVLRAIWARIYDAIVIGDGDLERVRQAARKGPLVLVPSHRSHVDYLVMSQIMMQHGMLPPHIAAGENLSFFPLGPLLRRGGAFFLRRSFKGDVLYGAVFRAYVRRLFKEGLTQEFFIEGGRSRTGKTLPPKLGILAMLVDAWLEGREDDAIFVPCHIAYEKIVEATSYTKELSGAAKQKERATDLVKAASVLRGRYGKVFVTFDEPISLKAHMAERMLGRDAHQEGDDDADAVRAATASLGHKIVYGINRSGLVTAMSLVCASLFGFRKKGLDESRLLRGADAVRTHIVRVGGERFEDGLRDDDRREALLCTALDKLVKDGLVKKDVVDDRTLYGVSDAAWLILDVHKNHLLHHAVPEAIVAWAVSLADGGPSKKAARGEVKKKARALSRALKLEFIFQPGVPFDALFDRALNNAAQSGFVTLEGDDVVVAEHGMQANAFSFAKNLIAGFVACYAVVLARIADVAGDGVDERIVSTKLLEAVKGAVLAGEVSAAEAASKATVDNAVALAVELGVVAKNGKLLTRAANVTDDAASIIALLKGAQRA